MRDWLPRVWSTTCRCFFDGLSTLFEYLPEQTIIVRSRQLEQPAQRFWQDIETRYEDRRYDRQRPVLAPASVFLSPEEIFRLIKPFSTITLETSAPSQFPALGSDPGTGSPMQALEAFLQQHCRLPDPVLC